MARCDYCDREFEPRKTGGRPQRFCPGGEHRSRFYAEARRDGARRRRRCTKKALFEDEIMKPENQSRVQRALTWAEARTPATVDAWR